MFKLLILSTIVLTCIGCANTTLRQAENACASTYLVEYEQRGNNIVKLRCKEGRE